MQLTDKNIEDGWEIIDGVACFNGVNDSTYKIKKADTGVFGYQLEILDQQGYTIAYGKMTKRFEDSVEQAHDLLGYEL